MTSFNFESLPPTTVTHTFLSTVEKLRGEVALRYTIPKPGAHAKMEKFTEQFEQIDYTWGDYDRESSRFAKSLIRLRVMPGQTVTIQGSNAPQWFFAHIGTMKAGGVSAGIYPTNLAEATVHCANNSEAVVAVVEDEEQLKKYENLNTSALKCFIVWNKVKDSGAFNTLRSSFDFQVYTWDEFMDFGRIISDNELTHRIQQQQPDNICTIIYTSGTTGMPKGAELTHDNVAWTAKVAGHKFQLDQSDHGISYLPLSHIAAQQVDLVTALTYGYQMDIAPPGALKGAEMKKHILNTRPTFFLAVPDVWNKMRDGMVEKMAQATGAGAAVKKFLFNSITPIARFCLQDLQKLAARGYSEKAGRMWHCADRIRAFFDTLALSLCNLLFLNTVKGLIGLDRCKVAASGSAPISPEVVNFFAGLGIRIVDLYGLSETSGLVTISSDPDVPSGSVGKPLPGTEVILGPVDEHGAREIRVKGRNIFQGYRHNLVETINAFDDNGYFQTGDAGEFDQNGNLKITGRTKELIKTSGGENIPPVLIEQKIREVMPHLISQVVVAGDRQKFLTCLITLKSAVNEKGETTLDPSVSALLKELGSEAKTSEQAANDRAVISYIDNGLKKANEKAVSQAQTVKKFTILPADFTVANGYMTATLKLKRKKIYQDFAPQIGVMYA